MSAEAVMILSTLERGEFEMAWKGAESPTAHLEGGVLWASGTAPAVCTCTIGGVVHRFDSESIVATIDGVNDDLRDAAWDAAEEAGEYLNEDEIEERVRQQALVFWLEQLEGEQEILAAWDAKMRYLVAGWQEFVAWGDMLVTRHPELTDAIAESREVARRVLTDALEAVIAP